MTTTDAVAAPVGPERLARPGPRPATSTSPATAPSTSSSPTRRPARRPTSSITYRDGAYEVWAKRGMIRFQRFYAADGAATTTASSSRSARTRSRTRTARRSPRSTKSSPRRRRPAFPASTPNTAYVEPEHVSYPFAYERIAQLFDSPNAPDLVVNPKAYAFGRQPGQHGALDVIQARSPLVFSGPGIKQGVRTDAPSRQIDIAPTIAQLCGFPLIDGKDVTGRTSSERGVAPDVYLKRQDGRVLDEIIDPATTPAAERAYIFLLDGQSNTELKWRLAERSRRHPQPAPPHQAAARCSSTARITNFPSITWPSHNAIGTGAWGGHHDIVNPTYYLRETREVVTPQGQQFDTAKFLGDGVETLYEAFHRVFGPWQGQHGAFTASIHEPCTRGADHATLERRRRRRPRPPARDHRRATPATPARSGWRTTRRARTASPSSTTAASRRRSSSTPTRRTRRRSSCSTS